MNCEPYDPPLRFLVSSAKFSDKRYLVDLWEYDGNGRCDCAHFRCKLEPKLKEGQRGEELWCKHIPLAVKEIGKSTIRVCITKEKYDSRNR